MECSCLRISTWIGEMSRQNARHAMLSVPFHETDYVSKMEGRMLRGWTGRRRPRRGAAEVCDENGEDGRMGDGILSDPETSREGQVRPQAAPRFSKVREFVLIFEKKCGIGHL